MRLLHTQTHTNNTSAERAGEDEARLRLSLSLFGLSRELLAHPVIKMVRGIPGSIKGFLKTLNLIIFKYKSKVNLNILL